MKKFSRIVGTDIIEIANPSLCSFGFFEVVVPTALAAISTSIASAGVAAGIGATTAGIIGDVGTGALVGGALGAATDWKQPLKGAEMGAITGAGIAGGPLLGGALGIGAIGGDVLAGTAAGALGGMASGRGAGMGALEGAASGLTAGALGSLSQVGSPTAGAGSSAAGAAAPGSVPLSGPEAVNVTPAQSLDSAIPSSVGANVPGSVGVGAATGVPTSTTGLPTPTPAAGAPAAAAGAPAASVLPAAAASPAPTPAVAGALSPPSLAGGYADSPIPASSLSSNLTSNLPAASVPDVPPTADPSFGQQLGEQFGAFAKSPTAIASTLGLAGNLIMGNKTPSGFSQMKSQAGMLTQQGGMLQSYLTTGQLPAGMQHSLDTAANAARASVRSQYANAGMSGSSAEAQDVQAVADREVEQNVKITEDLFNTGLKETELGNTMYWDLMQIQMKQDENLSSAIGNFVTSFANMGKAPPPTGQAAGAT